MSATEQVLERDTSSDTGGMIDCDVHTSLRSQDALLDYLPARWHQHHRTYGGNGYYGSKYPKSIPLGARVDAWPESGDLPGSDLALMCEQLLDRWNIDYAILNPGVHSGGSRNLDYAQAAATAINDMTVTEWLDRDARLRGSIVVSFEDPPAAVAEIERLADDHRFVQVYIQIRTTMPLGNRKYWPIYAAAERLGLPVGVHFGGNAGTPITGAGWPSYYLEDHVGNSQTFQSQLTSFIFEGVFEHFPALRLVAIEGGIAWAPPLAWRMDAAWQRLGTEVPYLTRPPSTYMADHVWFTTQPIEEPPHPYDFLQLLAVCPSLVDRIMFSTDYPHWDFDNPDHALKQVRLPAGAEPKILAGNARALYGL